MLHISTNDNRRTKLDTLRAITILMIISSLSLNDKTNKIIRRGDRYQYAARRRIIFFFLHSRALRSYIYPHIIDVSRD